MSQSNDLLDKFMPFAQVASKRAKKLSLFTLGISIAMTIFFLLSIVTRIIDAFSLRPSNIPKFEFSRLTTYPLVHYSFMQYLLSMAAFVPLCDRFEKRYGTLRTLAMFLGPFESVPGLLYCLVNGLLIRHDTAVAGCSGFVFVMVAIETVQSVSAGKSNVVFAGKEIPLYAIPFLLLLSTTLFLPGSSFTLHCASIAIGFVFGSGRVDFLLLPLKVVNFVELRVGPLVQARLPMYVTAKDADAYTTNSETELPISELPNTVSNQGQNILRSASPNPLALARKESNTAARPAGARQASSKWQSGQRED